MAQGTKSCSRNSRSCHAEAVSPEAPEEIRRRTINSPHPDSAQGQGVMEYFLYTPRELPKRPRVLVLVHGISRNACEHVESFQEAADHYRLVLVAPYFDEANFSGYQRLGAPSGTRSAKRPDVWLRLILDDVTSETGIATDSYFMFGHSGGGQFAHRLAMVHPHSVLGYVVSAAGWYTMPDYSETFPRGMKISPRRPEIAPDLEAFLNIPALVLIGDQDTVRDESFNRSPKLDAVQGRTRVERARSWVAAMTTAARWRGLETRFDLRILPGIGHDFTDLSRNNRIGHIVCRHLLDLPAQNTGPQASGNTAVQTTTS